jgi:hypothetical protein
MPPVNPVLVRHLSRAAELSAIQLDERKPIPFSVAAVGPKSNYLPSMLIYTDIPQMAYGAFPIGKR